LNAVISKKNAVRYLLIFFLTAIFALPKIAFAQDPTPQAPVTIYLFYGEGCPHCAKAKPYYESLENKYPEVILKTFEVYYDDGNRELFEKIAEIYQLEQLGVPATFIGSYHLLGYNEAYQGEIEEVVRQCLQNGCVDLIAGMLNGSINESERQDLLLPSVMPSPYATQTPPTGAVESGVIPSLLPPASDNQPDAEPLAGDSNEKYNLKLPFNTEINLNVQSITLSTMLIAFVDGFNPCSLWVLSMLLTLTLHTGSRKKVVWIGLIFLTVTSLIYALFIAGLFSVFKVAGFMGWIRIVIALIALFFALVNIKDYFWFKEGLSLTIADEKKPGIYKKMRAVLDAGKSFWGMAGATVVLAVGVSFVEFSCTAGFPVLWTSMISSQNISGGRFAFLLILYMLIYQLIAAVLFFSAVVSFKAARFDEKHGRFLKLLGGVLMLALSLVMLIDPALMNNLTSSLLIFGSAFVVSLAILNIQKFLQRTALPK